MRALRLVGIGVVAALVVVAVHLAAQQVELYAWLNSYCCGLDEEWSLNVATAAWVTASTTSVVAWMAAQRGGLAAAAAVMVGAATAGPALVALQESHVAGDNPHSLTRLVVTQVVAAVLGSAVGALAARWRVGVVVLGPVLVFWGFAIASQVLGAYRPRLAMITDEGEWTDPKVAPMYAGAAVVAGGLITWLSRRGRSSVAAGALTVLGFGLAVVAFRMADVSQSPDHGNAQFPYSYAHRLWWAVIVTTVLVVGVAWLVARVRRRPAVEVTARAT